jgi:hypothetical protein
MRVNPPAHGKRKGRAHAVRFEVACKRPSRLAGDNHRGDGAGAPGGRGEAGVGGRARGARTDPGAGRPLAPGSPQPRR